MDPRGELAARGREQAEAHRLMATGLLGQATVLALRETGATVHGSPQVEFELIVSVDDTPPYNVVHRQSISWLVLGNLQPGASVPVRVDPVDAHTVLIG